MSNEKTILNCPTSNVFRTDIYRPLMEQISELKRSGCTITGILIKVLPPDFTACEINIEWFELPASVKTD